jgi:23S rRNA pseudouridine2605 synthase
MDKKERIAKVLARAGLCSRRDAERWVEEGRVVVNGTKLDSPAFTVGDDDAIVVDGKPLKKAEMTRLYMFHKPAGLVTTAKDEQGRPTVFEGLPPHLGRLVSIGRLDINTEGLLLLTNDGALSRYMELPSTGWRRTYRVRVHGKLPHNAVEKLARGMKIAGVQYGAIEASIENHPEGKGGSNSWMTLTLTEGKNREIRKVMEALGLQVNRLVRLSYGPFHLGKLPRGGLEEISPQVVKEQIPAFFNEKLRDKSGKPAPAPPAQPGTKPAFKPYTTRRPKNRPKKTRA